MITGSFNWSPAAAHTNDETLLVIHSPTLAAHFTREMDRLWQALSSASPRGCSASWSAANGSAAKARSLINQSKRQSSTSLAWKGTKPWPSSCAGTSCAVRSSVMVSSLRGNL